MYWIESSTNYIAISETNSSYNYFAIDLPKNCKIVAASRVCEQHHIFSDDSEMLKCVIDLFRNHTIGDACVIHSTTAAETWIPISEDVYAFVAPVNTTLKSGQIIAGSGIITTDRSSVEVSNHTLIITDDNQSFSLMSPFLNLSSVMKDRPVIHNWEFHPSNKMHIQNLSVQMTELERQQSSINYHDVHHYSGPYIIILLIVIVVILWKKKENSTVIDHSKFFAAKK